MSKEKIILKNGTELPYDSINYQGNALVIGFSGGNATELEQTFREAGQTNLEEIKQTDAEGNLQTVHKLYDIFAQITIRIDAAESESGEKQNMVEVHLAQEELWQAEIRHIREEMQAGGGNPEAVATLGKRVEAVEQDVQTVVDAITGVEKETE